MSEFAVTRLDAMVCVLLVAGILTLLRLQRGNR